MKSGSKDFCKILTNLETQEPSCKQVWEIKLNLEANDATWRALFKGSLKIVTDNYLRWFQYKILYNMLDTNDYLFKIKVSDTNLCRLCKEYPETTVHLFVQCPQVISLWNNIVQSIKCRLLIQIDLTNARKILGYEQYDQHFWPLNFLLLISRQYIFSCAKNNYKPNIYFLQKKCEHIFNEQKRLSILNKSMGTVGKPFCIKSVHSDYRYFFLLFQNSSDNLHLCL